MDFVHDQLATDRKIRVPDERRHLLAVPNLLATRYRLFLSNNCRTLNLKRLEL